MHKIIMCSFCAFLWHYSKYKSLTLERRLALLEEGVDAFVFIFRREAERKQIHFTPEAFIQTRSRRQLHCFLRELQRNWTLVGDAGRDLHRFRLELVRGHNVIHK